LRSTCIVAATASGGRLTARLASPDETGVAKHGGRERSERSHPAAGSQKSPAQMLAEPALAAEPVANGQRSMARVLGLRVRRIVLDAGHGGHDSGTLGPGGLEEKDIALDVALRLGRLLQQRLGADVVYTRRTDVFVPLEQRTAIANRAHADLFLSLHANASADPQARGVETYFLNFTASPSALAVAARENAVSNRSVYELSDLVRKITLSDKINESREFAEDVQHSLYTGLAPGNAGLKDRGVKQAPFVVLIGANMPSILAEISFLTNPDDAAQLAEPAYRERLAEALYRGVARYVAGMSGIRVAKTAAPQVIAAPAE
jgi:N-acetylmuramoyl-L-alanine amidase